MVGQPPSDLSEASICVLAGEPRIPTVSSLLRTFGSELFSKQVFESMVFFFFFRRINIKIAQSDWWEYLCDHAPSGTTPMLNGVQWRRADATVLQQLRCLLGRESIASSLGHRPHTPLPCAKEQDIARKVAHLVKGYVDDSEVVCMQRIEHVAPLRFVGNGCRADDGHSTTHGEHDIRVVDGGAIKRGVEGNNGEAKPRAKVGQRLFVGTVGETRVRNEIASIENQASSAFQIF